VSAAALLVLLRCPEFENHELAIASSRVRVEIFFHATNFHSSNGVYSKNCGHGVKAWVLYWSACSPFGKLWISGRTPYLPDINFMYHFRK
jgi:hypothetical protein